MASSVTTNGRGKIRQEEQTFSAGEPRVRDMLTATQTLNYAIHSRASAKELSLFIGVLDVVIHTTTCGKNLNGKRCCAEGAVSTLKNHAVEDTCKRSVPWVGARVAWINSITDVRTPVSDPLVRARVHAYAKRQWRDRRTSTSRPLDPQ